jgi:hypothetical protein
MSGSSDWLLCGIIDELIKSASHTANVSFFFCQATDARINNATAVLRGLLYLLVKQQQSLVSHIRESYECTTDLSLLLNLVVQKSSAYSRVKWIVSSRN